MTRWGKSDYQAAWQADVARLHAAMTAEALDSDVPSCQGWVLGDLVEHITRIFLNYERLITATAPPPEDSKGMFDFEISGNALDEFDHAVRKLTVTLETVGLDDQAWVPAPVPRTAKYWFRRLVCETTVHRWDAQVAGAAAEPIDGQVAAEGIQEVLDTFIPVGRRREESEATGVIQLFAADIDRHWFVRLREGRESLLDSNSVDVDETAVQTTSTGTASDLYLALWGRLPVDALELAGDVELFRALRVQ